ncbi:MAG: glycoside hydrolase family 38 C-terminal domain-containing protein [Solitalea sp.]
MAGNNIRCLGRRLASFSAALLLLGSAAKAQNPGNHQHAAAPDAYFVDGYHGGIYGHYPDWQTRFMVDQLTRHPDWKISLEIEPETWDSVRVYDPEAYRDFREALMKPGFAERIDIVNPSYGQSYLYNISGESIIRQFDLGIRKMREHFPDFTYSTYSSEEPCFTSALPQILTSFGFKYAVLKNPNTCWGGYTRAFGGELVDWKGPDGTAIKTVPRYASEALEDNSTWQTKAWGNGVEYIRAALEQGIQHPVGMCLQDAAWDGGPWLGADNPTYRPSHYVTWTRYFEDIAIPEAPEVWELSQEDIQVSLVWGAHVLQKLAQQVRQAENSITMAEKLAAGASVYAGRPWRSPEFDEAWRNLALAQHHDCWIVPYNKVEGEKTWAQKVADWTGVTIRTSDRIIEDVLGQPDGTGDQPRFVHVFNSQGRIRKETVRLELDALPAGDWTVSDAEGNPVPVQTIQTKGKRELVFSAEARPLGITTYLLAEANGSETGAAPTRHAEKLANGLIRITTENYRATFNPHRGGVITSLKARKLGDIELIDTGSERALNELRGYFYEEGKFLSSADLPAEVTLVEDGGLLTQVSVKGYLGKHPFEQRITFYGEDKKIDFEVEIDWQGSPGIGAYSQMENYKAEHPEKAFYNDAYKLLVHFPLNLKNAQLYKNAPFDVSRSWLKSTFFSRWDDIKHNVILNWVDLLDEQSDLGVALFTDHTTSYAYAEDHPLALNIQYSGKALWGRNYRQDGPTRVRYALVPHRGAWDEAGIWMESVAWNEPLTARISSKNNAGLSGRSLVQLEEPGWEITAVQRAGNDLLVRVFNAEGSEGKSGIRLDGRFDSVQLVALNGEAVESLAVSGQDRKQIALSIPRFGIRTLLFKNFR